MTETTSARRIQGNVERFIAEMRKATERNMRAVIAERIEETAMAATSLSDHSLEDLRDLDHPYAKRHPKDKLHPDHLIHKQSDFGSLSEAFFSTVRQKGYDIVYTLRNDSDYWPYLRDGTDTMRKRPLDKWLGVQIKKYILPEFVKAQRQALRQFRRKIRNE